MPGTTRNWRVFCCGKLSSSDQEFCRMRCSNLVLMLRVLMDHTWSYGFDRMIENMPKQCIDSNLFTRLFLFLSEIYVSLLLQLNNYSPIIFYRLLNFLLSKDTYSFVLANFSAVQNCSIMQSRIFFRNTQYWKIYKYIFYIYLTLVYD